jgi:hypothetical protein
LLLPSDALAAADVDNVASQTPMLKLKTAMLLLQ